MTIEPIGSMMTAQAANYSPPPKSESPEVSREGIENHSAVQGTAQVDAQTVTVDKAGEKDGQSSGQQEYPKENPALSEELKKKIEEITQNIDRSNEEAVFGIHKGTGRVTIKIVDKENGDTLRELPPEKTLDMLAKLWEVAGLIVDEKR